MTTLAPATSRAPAAGATPKQRRRKNRPSPLLVAFVLVPFAVESIWVFWPALQGFYFSFTRWDGLEPPAFIGFGNYTELAGDAVFRGAVVNTLIWLVLFGGLSVLGGFGMALLLQRERRGVAFYRAALFSPVVFSLVVTALVWRVFYQPDGLADQLLRAVGLEQLIRPWLADPETALYAVILPALWRQIGYVMVLYLAGLKAIDPALQEAARVDGANSWQRLWKVTIPQLRGVNSVVLSVIVIDSLRSFDIVWALTRGGPYHSSELLSTYMYSTAFQSLRLGYGSAIAVVIFVLALAVILGYLVRAFREDA
ncbi:multiple sugar transport system permease protein [Micromonospora sp. A200]|uniref:carbohydrate ABC transporter permease n=1 Tax=Micromonospora sp. A200 TaxID=2940568 RepID=UPI0024765ACF|nr:sugar ABC transporter permease [Micromonospora sp. A200]MDH6464121.1 multiple sugar transport system permease protein [Micromonospora sp. A200]